MKPSKNIIENAITVDALPPYYVPAPVSVDADKLHSSFLELFSRLGLDYDQYIVDQRSTTEQEQQVLPPEDRSRAWDMCLSHVPGLVGVDRLHKYRGTYDMILAHGHREIEFTERLAELDGLYINEVIDNLYAYHKDTTGRIFQGRIHVIWIDTLESYDFHTDYAHTPVRYHVPVITNDQAVWVLRDNQDADLYYKLHMPVGTAWQFFPLEIEHSVANLGTEPRAHMVLTECLE